MKLDKRNVCVFIENEAQLQQAEDILYDNNQPIARDESFSYTWRMPEWNYLIYQPFFMSWSVGMCNSKNLITLAELEEILKGEKDGK